MRDHKAGTAFHQVIHRLLNPLLGSRINGAGRLIQYHDRIVRKDRTGDRKQLLLSLRDIACLLVQLHIISTRKRGDKVMCVGGLCSCNDFLIRSVQTSITNVFHDRSFKQPRIL